MIACRCYVCVEGGFAESLCTSSEMRHSDVIGAGHHGKSQCCQHPSHRSSLSQPCLPVSNVGPTRVLPFLFLGSQLDSMSRETIDVINVTMFFKNYFHGF